MSGVKSSLNDKCSTIKKVDPWEVNFFYDMVFQENLD